MPWKSRIGRDPLERGKESGRTPRMQDVELELVVGLARGRILEEDGRNEDRSILHRTSR